MTNTLTTQIAQALGTDMCAGPSVHVSGDTELPAYFAVSDLATASMCAAASELAALVGARIAQLDRRLASLWFDMTLRPDGWESPSAWDDLAGNYRASDGWIRLHTNAPHHRAAACDVLGYGEEKAAVMDAVSTWSADTLETAIIANGGAAAAMRSMTAWRLHPQGRAVSQEPLIAWDTTEHSAAPVPLDQVKLLDLTRVLAGPVATRFLTGFGAHVLRIDPPWWTEPGVEQEVTVGKRRAALDLTKTADRHTFEDLLSEAHVLVHGYRPGALAHLGYDRNTLNRRAPHLIDVSLNAYGWTGPWSDRRGFDSLVQMSCGIAYEGMRRAQVQHPVPLPVQALDHATGYLMAATVLRALRRRNKRGQITRARLSLARTGCLLMDAGARALKGKTPVKADTDFADQVEQTSWGPARRLRFPIALDGKGPDWRYPAGALGLDPPTW